MSDRLVDHALVRDHVRPHVVGHQAERLTIGTALRRSGVNPAGMDPALHSVEVTGVGQDVVSQGAPHHVGDGSFTEVSWPCGCGQPLHADPDKVLATWARHAGQASGVKPDRLEEHYLAALRGQDRPVAVCGCGQSFTAPDDNPHLSSLALEAWEQHVRPGG